MALLLINRQSFDFTLSLLLLHLVYDFSVIKRTHILLAKAWLFVFTLPIFLGLFQVTTSPQGGNWEIAAAGL